MRDTGSHGQGSSAPHGFCEAGRGAGRGVTDPGGAWRFCRAGLRGAGRIDEVVGTDQPHPQPSGIGSATGPEEFYDALATEYHLLFPDWWAAAQWHGEV